MVGVELVAVLRWPYHTIPYHTIPWPDGRQCRLIKDAAKGIYMALPPLPLDIKHKRRIAFWCLGLVNARTTACAAAGSWQNSRWFW